MNILVICTGNTCRSPMAEGILKKLLPRHNISSAGLFATDGGANKNAVSAAAEHGIDISAHSARQLTDSLAAEHDLLLCMTEGHKSTIGGKNCFTMGEYAKTGEQVTDPFGGDIAIYRQCFEQLMRLGGKIAERIDNEYKNNTD